MVLLTPLVAVFGTVLFWVVLALTFFPPALAVALLIRAEYGWALLGIAACLPWLKFGGPVRRFVFEGFEHGGL